MLSSHWSICSALNAVPMTAAVSVTMIVPPANPETLLMLRSAWSCMLLWCNQFKNSSSGETSMACQRRTKGQQPKSKVVPELLALASISKNSQNAFQGLPSKKQCPSSSRTEKRVKRWGKE